MAKKSEQEPEPVEPDALPAEGELVVVSASRPRAAWWPVAALSVLLLAFAATMVSIPGVSPLRPDAKAAYLEATPRLEGMDAITAPVPTVTPDPKSFAQKINIILPPPPPPPAKSGGRKGSGIAAGSASGLTYTAWCNAGGGASASASSLNGLLTAANAERAKWGFGALSWSSSLAGLAQDWSNTMANEYVFEDPKASFRHRGGVPENIALSWRRSGGGPAPQSQSAAIASAHAGWMTSSGHCKNILKPGYSVMGAGVATSGDGSAVYTTVNFG